MIGISRGFIRRKRGHGNRRAPRNRQIIAAKGYDGILICGVSVRVVRVRRKSAAVIQELAGGGISRAIGTREVRLVIHERWIKAAIQRVGLDETVEGHAEASAQHEAITKIAADEGLRTPRESKLWSEVVFAGVIEVAACTHFDVRKSIGTLT